MAEVWAAILLFTEQYKILFRIIVIVIAALLANWVLRLILRRAVQRIVRGVKRSQDVNATQDIVAGPHLNARAVQRTRTLGTLGRHIITWTITTVALFLVLDTLGVNVTALLASAGIIAAGLAFGAQNIVKDFLNGIFMVFEDQLGVGDLITVGAITGTVEDVGIRITKVRTVDGQLWFIRNGEILTLGNASQGWGRAIIDVAVTADTDLELVEQTLRDSAKELMQMSQYAYRITGQPEVLGIERATGYDQTIRLTLRTRAQAQYDVQRELRTIIKQKFTERGITLGTGGLK